MCIFAFFGLVLPFPENIAPLPGMDGARRTRKKSLKIIMESEEIIKKTPDYQHLTTSKTKIIPSSKRNLVRGNCQKKKELFWKPSLNTKLQKFKSYESLIDVYTFKTKFGKVYIILTPTGLLLEFSKNNFQEDLFLSLVKNAQCINKMQMCVVATTEIQRFCLTRRCQLYQLYTFIENLSKNNLFT